jgi:hypothetical protein
MDKSEALKRVEKEEDFIRYPKLDNSLSKFLDENPDGVDDATIARLLAMSEEEVQAVYQDALLQLRTLMGVK